MTVPRSGRLLVVAPHATRTGSTKVLLELLRRLPGEGGLDVDLAVELRTGGSLADELQALGSPLEVGERPRALLVNSALAASSVLDHGPEVPAAVYLHESGEVLGTLPDADVQGLRAAALVLCVSEHIADDAVAFGVARERTAVLPPLIAPVSAPAPAAVAAVRTHLGAADSDAVILGCGEARWGKGPDLFVALASELGPVGYRFGWLGRRQRAFARQLDHDVRAAGLEGVLRWFGDVEDPIAHLAAAQVLVVPSRDDPQPLVPLEAAQVGVPAVAFARGGLVELAEAGAALAAPYPDVVALAELVRACIADPHRAEGLVGAARARIAERQAPEVVVAAFARHLVDLLG